MDSPKEFSHSTLSPLYSPVEEPPTLMLAGFQIRFFFLGKIMDSPMLPSAAAPSTGQGVSAVMPSGSAYRIHTIAIENRICQKLMFRMPFTKSQMQNTVKITVNTLTLGRIPNWLTITYTAANRKKIPQKIFPLFLLMFIREPSFLLYCLLMLYHNFGKHMPSCDCLQTSQA